PFYFAIEGTAMEGGKEDKIAYVPKKHLVFEGNPRELVKVEQVFDVRTAPVKRVDALVLGKVSSRHSMADLQMTAFSSTAAEEEGKTAAPAPVGGIGPGGIPGGPGGPGGPPGPVGPGVPGRPGMGEMPGGGPPPGGESDLGGLGPAGGGPGGPPGPSGPPPVGPSFPGFPGGFGPPGMPSFPGGFGGFGGMRSSAEDQVAGNLVEVGIY